MIKAIIFDCYGVLVRQDFLYRKVLNEPLLVWIREHQRNFVFSILSNIDRSWLDEHIDATYLAYFIDIGASSETGVAKPDKKAYTLAAQRLGLAPAECIFVDDVLGNVEAARAVGMRSIHYKDFAQFEQEIKKLLQ